MIGENVRRLRRKNDMSMDKLAETIGVSKNAIKKYELNQMSPSYDNLIKLANAFNIEPSKLLEEYPNEKIQRPLYHRCKSNLAKKDREYIELEIRRSLNKYLEALKLDCETRMKNNINFDPIHVESLEDIEAAADTVRQRLNLSPLGPVISLVALFENAGILVVSVKDAPKGFDAEFGIIDDHHYMAYADTNNIERTRHTITHEMGHVFLSVPEDIDEERAMSYFAGCFLFPKANVYEELGKKRKKITVGELLSIVKEYGISAKSIVFRAKQLDIISESAAKELYISINQHRERLEGQYVETNNNPSMLVQIVLSLFAEEIISMSKASELLDIGNVSFRKMLEGVSN